MWIYFKIDEDGHLFESVIVDDKEGALHLAIETAMADGYGNPGDKVHRARRMARESLETFGNLVVDEVKYYVAEPRRQKGFTSKPFIG